MKDGEIDKKRSNIGFLGKGYKFNAEEESQVKNLRMELSKGYGYVNDKGEEE